MTQSSTPIDRECEALDRLIADAAVRCAYQPIIDLRTGEAIGFEALTRVDESTGFADPGELFDAALRCGRLWALELLTRRVCIESIPEDWPDGALLFLNCNPDVVADERLADVFLEMVSRSDRLTPERVVLEITERAETPRIQGLAQQVGRLRAAGVQIAIDDLGAGVSGLQQIMELRPHWLKLDSELTAGVEHDPYRQNLLDVLLRFARVSGVRLVAEGVESLEQLDMLMDLGVQHAQGFLIARPDASLTSVGAPLASWLRDRQVRVKQRGPGCNLTFLASVMRQTAQCPADADLRAALDALEQAPDAAGVAAIRGGAVVGWVSRDQLRRAARRENEGAPLATLLRSPPVTAPASMLISESLLMLSSSRRQDHDAPVLVLDGNTLVGEVSQRSLLREAARLVADQESDHSQLSGLPGRVECDRRLATLVADNEDASACFIDIRGFHEFNERCGYDMGDLLLRILAGLVVGGVEESASDFAGHLADDRFLLVTSDDPDAVALTLIRQFETATDRFITCAEHEAPSADPAGLRCVILRRPGVRCVTASEAHEEVSGLRAGASGRRVGRSVILDSRDTSAGPAMRLSA